MLENGKTGEHGGLHGAQTNAEQAKEHLRAAKDSAAEAARGAAEAARGASKQARDWGRSRFAELQDRVEAEPYRAGAWALGIGFVAGVLITALASSSRRRD